MPHNSSSSDDRNVEPANEDASAEKERLLRDIQKLRCLVKQCKWSLQTVRFKEVEERVTKKQRPKTVSTHRLPNVDVDLQTDLYRFGGFRCVTFRKNEFIFNFTSISNEQKANTNALQIFIKDGRANLGKWVMPMSIDMNQILSKTPLDELKNLTAFIKNCKHNADCYTVRQEQFLSLKKHISNMKQCNLQSDIGFRQINLELYGVHDKENDKYINLVIHLLYYSDKARPYKIEVGTTNNNKLSDDTKQKLKMCLKEFKISDLQTAFDKILTEDNPIFTWMRTDDSDSPLELNDTSNSDEEDFLAQLQSERKKSLRKLKKKRELQKKWNERKRQRNIRGIESPKNSHPKAKVSRTKSLRRIPIREKKAEKAKSISGIESPEDSRPKAKVSRTESPRRIPIREKKADKAKSISGIESSEDSQQEDSHPKAKVSRTESPRRIPIREKKAEKAKSISGIESPENSRPKAKVSRTKSPRRIPIREKKADKAKSISGIESSEDSQQEDSHPKAKVSRIESPRRIPIREKKANKAKSISGIESLEDSQQEDSHPKAKVSRTESPRRIPIREKKADKAKSISKQDKINKNLLEETTPRYKLKNKLKQTKLNFQTHETTNSNTNEVTLFKSKPSNSKQLEAAKIITSTPLNCSVNVRRIKPLSPTLEINNITSIKTTRKTANKLDDSKNSDQLNNEKTQKKNDRLLRSATKTTRSVSKTNKRLTRSMITKS